ncbi:hypothetical protein LUZ60_014593 [Juncus effusus]|nr:hypothetical protein LUZ60_014593 [Juncus effusus]
MEYERHFSYYPPTSPTQPQSQKRDRHRNHIICFSSCFRSSPTDEVEASLVRSPSTCVHSKAHEFPDELLGKCHNLLRRHKRRHSSDFGYDPLSYARNFDDGGETTVNNEEEFPYRCFSSRLPPSPQLSPNPVGSVTGQIGGGLPLLDICKAKGKGKAKDNDVAI